MHAAHFDGQRHQPVKERRLFKIQNPVQPRRDPIAGGDHLARNFGVAAFIGICQRAQAAHGKINQPQPEGQQRDIFENLPRFPFIVDHAARSKTWNTLARNRNSFDSTLDSLVFIV